MKTDEIESDSDAEGTSPSDRGVSEIKIHCEGVWKVFGKEAGKVMASSSEERSDLARSLRCTIAVREASFDVREGEVFVIMGLSGSGKSTLLRCINHLIDPSGGRVVIDGRNLEEMSAKELRRMRQEQMGMVFQNFALLPHRTVLENAAFGLEVQRVPKAKRHERAREALDLVGLSDWSAHFPGELSGGMQQRVGLARALALNPEILLMDEAFSALDPLIRKQMQEEFLKLVAIVRKTIVFITHDLDEALKIADRIAVMKDGRIVQIGTPEQIVMRPADEYVAEFVGSVSRTKVVSARNFMMEPDRWISAEGEDPIAVLNRMRKNNLESIFVTDAANRLVGVIDKARLTKALKKGPSHYRPVINRHFPSVFENSHLEDIISEAAQNEIPIAVLDAKRKLVGVISRSRLLDELVDVI